LHLNLNHGTEKLDAQGLNHLQRNGTLPMERIPPGAEA
jgi:hypothetical protein